MIYNYSKVTPFYIYICLWVYMCVCVCVYTYVYGFPWWLSGKEPACNARDTGDAGSIPVSGRSSGGGHGDPLQYYCLENPMHRGAWRATVYGVAKSHTWLKWLSTHTRICVCVCVFFLKSSFPWWLSQDTDCSSLCCTVGSVVHPWSTCYLSVDRPWGCCGLLPDQCKTLSITVERVTRSLWLPSAYKSYIHTAL